MRMNRWKTCKYVLIVSNLFNQHMRFYNPIKNYDFAQKTIKNVIYLWINLYLFWILTKLCFILILYSNLVYFTEANVNKFKVSNLMWKCKEVLWSNWLFSFPVNDEWYKSFFHHVNLLMILNEFMLLWNNILQCDSVWNFLFIWELYEIIVNWIKCTTRE